MLVNYSPELYASYEHRRLYSKQLVLVKDENLARFIVDQVFEGKTTFDAETFLDAMPCFLDEQHFDNEDGAYTFRFGMFTVIDERSQASNQSFICGRNQQLINDITLCTKTVSRPIGDLFMPHYEALRQLTLFRNSFEIPENVRKKYGL